MDEKLLSKIMDFFQVHIVKTSCISAFTCHLTLHLIQVSLRDCMQVHT